MVERSQEVVALDVHVTSDPEGGFSYQVPLSDGSRYVSRPYPTAAEARRMGEDRAASRLWIPVGWRR